MDFEQINGFSDEEIKELYQSAVDEDDYSKTSFCGCYVNSYFGVKWIGGVGCNPCYWPQTYGNTGSCSMQILSYEECDDACIANGLGGNDSRYVPFNTHCYCDTTRTTATWDTCKR